MQFWIILNLALLASINSSFQLRFVKDTSLSGYIESIFFYEKGPIEFEYGVIFKTGSSPQYPIIKWERFLSGDWDELYLKYKIKRISTLLGRWKNKWSYSDRYSLILNDTIPSRNGFWIKAMVTDNINFEYLLSTESSFKLRRNYISREGDTLSKGEVIHRTLIAHKLEWRVKNLGLYFAEIAYCPSLGFMPNPLYLNPLFLYFLLQFNDSQLNHGIESDANILWDFGVFYRLRKLKFYGELLIDDFQYRKGPTNEPPQIGFLIGAYYKTGGISFIAEYTRVWAWTYLHENPWERYETLGYSLGHPYGPDFDEMFMKVEKNLSESTMLGLNVAYRRKGEPDIHTDWPIKPYGKIWDKFPTGSDFLWGTIEYKLSSRLEFLASFKNFDSQLVVGLDKYKNYGHVQDNIRFSPIIGLNLSYKFSK